MTQVSVLQGEPRYVDSIRPRRRISAALPD
jgi:hypothetical protein